MLDWMVKKKLAIKSKKLLCWISNRSIFTRWKLSHCASRKKKIFPKIVPSTFLSILCYYTILLVYQIMHRLYILHLNAYYTGSLKSRTLLLSKKCKKNSQKRCAENLKLYETYIRGPDMKRINKIIVRHNDSAEQIICLCR